MTKQIRDVMTTQPRSLTTDTPVAEAAKVMRDENIGDILITQDGELTGILTDRDIVVRVLAENLEPTDTSVGDIASQELVTVTPQDSVDDAVQLMRQRSLRRIPVVEGGKCVGIVSLGDLAVEKDPDSALADISAAPPNE
ncbi:MAG TPA: CBS domain-containing protein [Actinomycetota bacterium]|nr:CBS domain-containing protein [Actinomycetota bacterium]